MNINACIFDLDGVITDTAESHYRSWKEVAAGLGIDFSVEMNEQLKGVGRRESLLKILSWGGVTLSEEELLQVMERKNGLYQEYIKEIDKADVYAGMDPFLRELKDSGIAIGLGSSSKNARAILASLGITHYFDVIIDGNDITNSKPDPEVFVRGANALGIDPSNCVVFEDAESGVEAALAGGFAVIGVGHADVLSKADHVIPGFSDFSMARLTSLYS